VRQGYLTLAHAEPQRWLVLDATRDQSELSQEIVSLVSQLSAPR
jgi:dTMP kinase